MEDKRRKILEAAKNVFVKKGFHGSSIKDIALKAGVAQGTPYLYFKSKEDLLSQLICALLNKTNEEFKKVADTGKSLWDKLDDFVSTTLTNVYKDREFSSLLLSDGEMFRSLKGINSRKMVEIFSDRTKTIEKVFEKYEKNGELDKDLSAKDAAQVFSMFMAGFAHRIIMGLQNDLNRDIRFATKILRKILNRN